jgi:hypothetical protein
MATGRNVTDVTRWLDGIFWAHFLLTFFDVTDGISLCGLNSADCMLYGLINARY